MEWKKILQHIHESDIVGDIKNSTLDENQRNNAMFIANHDRNRGNPWEKETKIRQALWKQVTSKNGLKTKLNEQRATKQNHTPIHAVGIFKALKGPVHGYHNTSVAHATMTLVIYRTLKIDHFHYLRNEKIPNRSMNKDKNLGCYRNQL